MTRTVLGTISVKKNLYETLRVRGGEGCAIHTLCQLAQEKGYDQGYKK